MKDKITQQQSGLITEIKMLSLADMGYKGDPKDTKAVIEFLKADLHKANKKIASLQAYDKQYTTTSLSLAKTYNSKYHKPNKHQTTTEVIEDALAISKKEFYKQVGNINEKPYKLLDCAITQLTSQTTYKKKNPAETFNVSIDIKNYLTSIGKEPTPTAIKYFKKQIKQSYANVLQSLQLVITEENKKNKTWSKTQIPFIETVAYDSSNIYINFFPKFAELLTYKGKIKQHAKCLYRSSNHNVYALGSKLEEYYGIKRNILKSKNNKLSTKVLLRYCPEIPTEQDLQEQNDRHYTRKIIEPFQKAMQELLDIRHIESWQYASNSPLKEEKQAQLDSKNITDFKLFKKLYIVYELSNFPRDIEPLKIEQKQCE